MLAWDWLNDVPHPVVLFCDGYAGHLGLEIAEFCVLFGIKLWRLKENTTHVTLVNVSVHICIKF